MSRYLGRGPQGAPAQDPGGTQRAGEGLQRGTSHQRCSDFGRAAPESTRRPCQTCLRPPTHLRKTAAWDRSCRCCLRAAGGREDRGGGGRRLYRSSSRPAASRCFTCAHAGQNGRAPRPGSGQGVGMLQRTPNCQVLNRDASWCFQFALNSVLPLPRHAVLNPSSRITQAGGAGSHGIRPAIVGLVRGTLMAFHQQWEAGSRCRRSPAHAVPIFA